MDKLTFYTILECALLNFDNVDEEKLVNEYGLDRRLVKVGVKLCEYLKSIKI